MRRPAVTAALLCALCAAPAAHATFPGQTGRIAFDVHGSNRDDQDRRETYRQLLTVRPDSRGDHAVRECLIQGSGVRLGDCSIDYRAPAWAPNGRRLAFDAGRSLALVSSDDTGFRLLAPFTADDSEPAWSRSGRQLVFTGRQGSTTGLYVADPATRRVKRIVRRGSGPDWSRRNRIAFERGGSVYTVTPAGRGLRRVARGKDPGWAPSGASLVLARRNGIYSVRADGKRLRRILRCSRCATPVLSPNGRLVAYEESRGLRVARVRDGRVQATLVFDFSSGTDAVNASNPDWQAR